MYPEQGICVHLILANFLGHPVYVPFVMIYSFAAALQDTAVLQDSLHRLKQNYKQ